MSWTPKEKKRIEKIERCLAAAGYPVGKAPADDEPEEDPEPAPEHE